MDENKLLNLLTESIPDIFKKKRGNILYIYPSENGLLIDKFKEARFIIDCLEPEYRAYHEAMLSGIYRLVVNEEVKYYDPQIEYDIIIWLGIDNVKELLIKKIEDISEEWSDKLIMVLETEEKSIKEGFILKKYKVSCKDSLMVVWRNN